MDKLVKLLDINVFVILKKEFPDKWQYLNKNIAYRCEYFSNIDDYKKPVDNSQREDIFSKSKNNCPEGDEITRTKEIIKIFDIKNGEELTKLYLKIGVISLPDIFEKFVKVSTEEYGKNPLNCTSLSGYTYQCALIYTDFKL